MSGSPGVSGTCGHLVLLVTVAARVIHRAPRVGQVIRGVGDTHLTQGTLSDGLAGWGQTLTFHTHNVASDWLAVVLSCLRLAQSVRENIE